MGLKKRESRPRSDKKPIQEDGDVMIKLENKECARSRDQLILGSKNGGYRQFSIDEQDEDEWDSNSVR